MRDGVGASGGLGPHDGEPGTTAQTHEQPDHGGYRRLLGLMSAPYRYDVVTVLLPTETESGAHVELLKSFWTDEKLRKQNWHEARWD